MPEYLRAAVRQRADKVVDPENEDQGGVLVKMAEKWQKLKRLFNK